jgi:hypothetical protein
VAFVTGEERGFTNHCRNETSTRRIKAMLPIFHAVTRLPFPALVVLLASIASLHAETTAPCTDDAMIVFDASGSMAGNLNQGIATLKPRIDEVRAALADILPERPASAASASSPMARDRRTNAMSRSISSQPRTPLALS